MGHNRAVTSFIASTFIKHCALKQRFSELMPCLEMVFCSASPNDLPVPCKGKKLASLHYIWLPKNHEGQVAYL